MVEEAQKYAPPPAQIPSNATRIARAIKHFDDNGTPQIVMYQRGAGTNGDTEDQVWGGVTGSDVSEHVREAYAFLADNFNPETQKDLDDPTKPLGEITLFGFSRGAFTARAISSLISDVGLLTKIGMESFWGIFGDWMKQDVKGLESIWFRDTFGKNAAFGDREYRQTLIDNGLTRWGMPIRAVGVWDTVGPLGIPLPWDAENVKDYSFVNTKVANNVQHAFQAMALDEKRGFFSPTLWEEPEGDHKLKVLKQCWFAGVHSNIGGGYPDAGLSNITLAWMISQIEDHDGGILSFDHSYLDWLQDKNTKAYVTNKESIRPWGLGEIYNSMMRDSVLNIAESLYLAPRTPGRYCRIDTDTGKQTKTPLTNTMESVHRSVRVRITDGGLDVEDDNSEEKGMLQGALEMVESLVTSPSPPVGKYQAVALKEYDLVIPKEVQDETEHSAPGKSGVVWRAKTDGKVLPEDEMGITESKLYRRSVITAVDIKNGLK
ncbi:hypothetical protein F5884DRAFT_783894 [Xylogone sp. PMI_703]|nr:hypothetical protein F5884DRAFT_783894 [Xylogone sp. PMI_703]